MSKLIHDWLVCGQSLPIEGVGLLHWERQRAAFDEERSAWNVPRWVLRFDEDPQLKMPTDFFMRLRSFSGQSAQPVEALYGQWLRSFKSDQSMVSLWGLGAFERDQDKWQWKPSDVLPQRSVQVASLTKPSARSVKQYDLPAKLLMILSAVAIAWSVWQGAKQGLQVEVSRSRESATIQDLKPESLLYQEVR